MLLKCAAPDSLKRFKYMIEGRLFVSLREKSPGAPLEYFWLCEDCSRTYTFADDHLVLVIERPVSRRERAA